MLQGLDDTIQVQSEALWEINPQRGVNANLALLEDFAFTPL